MTTPLQAPRKKPEWAHLPTLEDSDEKVREYLNRTIAPMSYRRRYNTQRAALNLWFYLGRQWIEPRSELVPGSGVYHFREIYRNSLAAFPRPVTNIIAPSVDNEVARLGRKELIPDTSAGKNKPEWQAASRLAKDILMAEMAREVWPDKRDELHMNFCLESIAILRTAWDENDSDLALVAAPGTVKCPTCGRKYASREIPRSFLATGIPSPDSPGQVAMAHTDTLEAVQEQGEASAMFPKGIPRLSMKECPYCESASALEPYPVSEEEAMDSDAFGRQLGLLVPRGEGMIDPLSIHQFYPESGGVDVEPRDQVSMQSMCVRSLEWIALRYPEFGDELEAEEPSVMLRQTPLYAEPILSGLSGHNAAIGQEAFQNHARLQECVILPHPHVPGLQRGAIFHRLANGTKVLRQELMVEVKGEEDYKYVPRIKYHFARFKRIPRNFYGRTFVDDLIPIQRRLNELDAQVIDLRERGKPTMYMPKGTEIYDRDDLQGSMVYTEFESPNPEWSPAAGVFPGIPITGNPYFQERGQIMEDAQRVGFPQDIEIGQAPGSVKTTSGLMLISEEASQTRAPRERALALMYEAAFTHLLEMNWAFRKEEQQLEIESEAGVYEYKSFVGTDLVGGIRVKVNARAGYDQTLYNKEAASEALQLGLYQIDSPDARDKLLDLLKLPKDVNEGSGIQVRRAEMAWSDFMRLDKVPTPDYTMWDFPAFLAIFRKRWMGDDCMIRQRDAGFDEIWSELVTWEQKLAMFDEQEQRSIMYKEVPPEQWAQVYEQGQKMVAEAKASYEAAQTRFNQLGAQGAALGAAAPTPPQPPMMTEFPPPPQVPFLPDPLHEKIYEVWMRMMPQHRAALEAAKTSQGSRGGQFLEMDLLLRMRAVVEACRMSAEPPMPMMPPEGAPPEGGAPPM